MKFCFLCGKKSNKLIEGYCEKCYNEKINLIEVPKKINITICTKCMRIKEKNRWRTLEIEDLVKRKIKILGKKVNIEVDVNNVLKIYAKGFPKKSNKIKEEHYEIQLKQKKLVCPTCHRRLGDYHEGIIQLRGSVTREVLDLVDDQMTAELLKDNNVFYKIKKVRGGYDLYMSDKHITNKISDVLRKKFKAEIKKTYKLVTKKKGKDIYKSTVLVRI